MRKTSLLIPVHVLGLAALSVFFHPPSAFEAAQAEPTGAEAALDAREAAVHVAEVVLQAHFEVTSVVEVVAGERVLQEEDVRGTFGDVELRVDVRRQRALARVTGGGSEHAFLMLLKRVPKRKQRTLIAEQARHRGAKKAGANLHGWRPLLFVAVSAPAPYRTQAEGDQR